MKTLKLNLETSTNSSITDENGDEIDARSIKIEMSVDTGIPLVTIEQYRKIEGVIKGAKVKTLEFCAGCKKEWTPKVPESELGENNLD